MEQEFELTAEEQETRIDRALEVEEKIRETDRRLKNQRRYAGGGVVEVCGIEATGERISSERIRGLDVHGDPGEIPEEVAILYQAPDGSKWRATVPFPVEQNSTFFRLLDYAGVPRDQPSELMRRELPAVYTGRDWRLHIPPGTSVFGTPLTYRWHRVLIASGCIDTIRSTGSRARMRPTKKGGKWLTGMFLTLLMLTSVLTVVTGFPMFILLFPLVAVLPALIDLYIVPTVDNLLEAERINGR